MKNITRIYKILLKHWGYIIGGFIFMQGFAIFSGFSLMMAIPLFDYVFKSNPANVIYRSFPVFWEAISNTTSQFIHEYHGFFKLFQNGNYKSLLHGYEDVLSKTDPLFLLWTISFTMVGLIIFKNIFYYGNRLMVNNLRGKSVTDIRNMMFDQYLTQSLTFFNKNKVGDSLVRIISDVSMVNDFFIASITNVVQNIILLIMYTWIAVMLNGRLFLISLLLLPIFSFIVSLIGKKIKKYSARLQNQSSNLFSNIEETLNGIKIVKAFSREDTENEKFGKLTLRHFQIWRKSVIYKAFGVPLTELHSTIMGIIVLLIGGRQVLAANSVFSLGDFMTFILAVFSMMHPLKQLTNAYSDIRKALVSLDRISEVINRKSEITEISNPVAKKSFDTKIEFDSVVFSYNSDKMVLNNVSLSVNKGEKIALVGGSGSGKTTLMNLLNRMYDVQKGDIKIDGISIKDMKLTDLRTLFGIVTQESILFNETIANNIRYGSLEDVSDEAVKEVAEIAYADEFIDKMKNGYEEILNPKANNLSGGQKQRICIARAIIGNPPILIFDEATSALDTESEQKVQMAIDHATMNRTVFVIAHRLSTILKSDKIVVLEKGKIVGIGKHDELLSSCKRYKELYNIQFSSR
ncbi:MAG: ABC transporter ATP-binding protein/permease [Candidatus Cloacimonetes bacterium]|nr:ABC transporter ATP-binding protein/permease [Candidatus Cloacimonadota bacterium]